MSNLSDRRIAQVRLTEADLKRMAVEEVLKSPDAKLALEGKKIYVEVDWHVFKWDDPQYMATFVLFEED